MVSGLSNPEPVESGPRKCHFCGAVEKPTSNKFPISRALKVPYCMKRACCEKGRAKGHDMT